MNVTLTKTDYPTRMLSAVVHIGCLNKANKRQNSLEGAGLSVSLHPAAWQQIAKLGGHDWHTLSKMGARFLDFHALSDAQQQEITRWGITNGYAEESIIYFRTWLDENEEPVTIESSVYNEIEAELDEDETVQEKRGVKALPRLSAETMNINIPPFLVLDLLATIYAEQVLALDGVWWDDILDPAALSAPRGVINLTSLKSWSTSNANK